MNASVQENVSGIRVVKAFVREDHETKKFSKAANNLYKLFVKAENCMVSVTPIMQLTVYACIIAISWFGANMIVGSTLTTGELSVNKVFAYGNHTSSEIIALAAACERYSSHPIAMAIKNKAEKENFQITAKRRDRELQLYITAKLLYAAAQRF